MREARDDAAEACRLERVLVSACLLGQPVRYDGSAKSLSGALIERWSAQGRLVAICPESAAGFPTPRPAAEIASGADGADVLAGRGRVIESAGRDVTDLYIAGARAALELARRRGCRFALLTDGSPSCGGQFIYGGDFDGVKHPGAGVTTALLRANGVEVFTEIEIELLADKIR